MTARKKSCTGATGGPGVLWLAGPARPPSQLCPGPVFHTTGWSESWLSQRGGSSSWLCSCSVAQAHATAFWWLWWHSVPVLYSLGSSTPVLVRVGSVSCNQTLTKGEFCQLSLCALQMQAAFYNKCPKSHSLIKVVYFEIILVSYSVVTEYRVILLSFIQFSL